MADSGFERKKKLVAEFEQIARNWLSGKPGVVEVIEYLEKEKKKLQVMKARRKKQTLSEKEILKFVDQLGYAAERIQSKSKRNQLYKSHCRLKILLSIFGVARVKWM